MSGGGPSPRNRGLLHCQGHPDEHTAKRTRTPAFSRLKRPPTILVQVISPTSVVSYFIHIGWRWRQTIYPLLQLPTHSQGSRDSSEAVSQHIPEKNPCRLITVEKVPRQRSSVHFVTSFHSIGSYISMEKKWYFKWVIITSQTSNNHDCTYLIMSLSHMQHCSEWESFIGWSCDSVLTDLC